MIEYFCNNLVPNLTIFIDILVIKAYTNSEDSNTTSTKIQVTLTLYLMKGVLQMKELQNKREQKRTKKVIHCDICGRIKEKYEKDNTLTDNLKANGWVEFQPKTRNRTAWVDMDCIRIKSYSTKNDVIRWSDGDATEFDYSFEFESRPNSIQSHALLCSRDYMFLPTSDCSLDEGFCEYKTLIYKNLHGLKQIFTTYSENATLNNRCGSHINIGGKKLQAWSISQTGRAIDIISENINIFQPLTDYLYRNEKDCIKIFGRYFNEYAEQYLSNSSHYSSVRMKENCIEYRLAKFITAQQYFELVNLCKELTNIACEWAIYGDNTPKSKIDVSEKMIITFKKYVEGKANCQRAERNSKK